MKAALGLRKVLFFRVLTEQNDPEASRKGMSPTSKEPTSSHHTREDCVLTREGGDARIQTLASALSTLSPHPHIPTAHQI